MAHWVREGKLTEAPGGGLVQHNDKQQIDVDAAVAALKISLDAGQSLGNAAETHGQLDLIAAGSPPSEVPEAKPPPPAVIDDDARRYKQAKAELAEQQAALGRRDMAREMGRWVDRAEAQAAFQRETQKLMDLMQTVVEQSIPIAVAEALGTNPAETAAAIRTAYRAERAALSKKLTERAGALEQQEETTESDAA